MNDVVKIGSGAGFAADRILPAKDLAERGDIDYLVFECLAERTIALAHLERMADPAGGYNEWLEDRLDAALPSCAARNIKIITNMGAANPEAAGRKTAEIAARLGLKDLKIAVVTGDDVVDALRSHDYALRERDTPVSAVSATFISANAYIGCEPIVEALQAGADIVITGRTADPSLYIAPLIYEFDWAVDDWELLGKGTLVGHLLECAAQVTGGYFIDPGLKDVPDPAHLGFPIAEVEADGTFVVTKIPGSGGRVSIQTCREQALYEVHDPARYYTPDCVADFSQVRFEEIAPDRIRVTGATGYPKTDTLKVSVGYRDGYIGEGQISYCGPNAVARGRLALDMVEQRIKDAGIETVETRFELIGVDALLRGAREARAAEPAEVRIRVAARTRSLRDAKRVGHEVEALWLNGPAGGGGATKTANEVVAIASVLIPRSIVTPTVSYLEV